MTTEEHLATIESALKGRRLHVSRVEDTFNVRQGQGPLATKAHVDPRPLLEVRADDPFVWRRQVAGFASGVKHVLLEPKRSDAGSWEFVDSAGGLLPTIQSDTFSLGVEAACGEQAWTLPFCDDLQVAYLVRLPNGLRPVTVPQVEHWGVSEDRVTSAARSLLFHKTRQLSFKPYRDLSQVRRLKAGDGHDAARCLVVGDAFYSEVGDDFRFSLPTPEHFLCVHQKSPETLAQLRQATAEVLADTDYPLTEKLFRFRLGKPELLQESSDER